MQILSGANPGEEVVVVGGMGLDDNSKVKIITTAVEESDDEDDQNDAPAPMSEKKADAKKDQAKPEMSDVSIAPPIAIGAKRSPLDGAPRQAYHLRDSYVGRGGRLSGGIDSRVGIPEHGFPAHCGGRRRGRLSDRPNAG